jgi:hypothetical protein
LLKTWNDKESGDSKQWDEWVNKFTQIDWKSIELAFKD